MVISIQRCFHCPKPLAIQLCATYRGSSIIRIGWLWCTGRITALITGPAKVFSPPGIDFLPRVPAHVANVWLTIVGADRKSEGVAQPQAVYFGLVTVGITVVEWIVRISLSSYGIDPYN